MGISDYESKSELDTNRELKIKLENIRLLLEPKMNLSNVKDMTVPKMTLISNPKSGRLINTRTFIPHVCHTAIGVMGATSVSSGCLLAGSVAEGLAKQPNDLEDTFTLEHSSGSFDVKFSIKNKNIDFIKSRVVKTARAISKGEVFIPH